MLKLEKSFNKLPNHVPCSRLGYFVCEGEPSPQAPDKGETLYENIPGIPKALPCPFNSTQKNWFSVSIDNIIMSLDKYNVF